VVTLLNKKEHSEGLSANDVSQIYEMISKEGDEK